MILLLVAVRVWRWLSVQPGTQHPLAVAKAAQTHGHGEQEPEDYRLQEVRAPDERQTVGRRDVGPRAEDGPDDIQHEESDARDEQQDDERLPVATADLGDHLLSYLFARLPVNISPI